MKKVGFIGAFDKTDMIIYLSKLLVGNDLKILIIDSTKLEKTRYTVPTINPSKYYITNTEGIDIAVGFNTIEEIINYFGEPDEKSLPYDYIFIDIDENEKIDRFKLGNSYKNYFVTGFDNYSLQKGMGIIGKDTSKKKLTKIIFSRDIEKSDESYLDFVSFYYAVEWQKEKIYFPFEHGDLSTIIENQRSAKIRFMYLTDEYKQGLLNLAQSVYTHVNIPNLKKMLKNS